MIKVNVDSIRLDRFVANVLQKSWGSSQKLIRGGFIKVQGKREKDCTLKVYRDEEIEIRCFAVPPALESKELLSETTLKYQSELNDVENSFLTFKKILLFEDENYLVVNKPEGFSSQGGADPNSNIPHLASNYLAKSNQTHKQMKIMHRIDQPVSGLLFIAKSVRAASQFGKMLEARDQITKEYICVTAGVPKQPSGVIDAPLSFHANSQRARVVNYTEEHKESRTHYRVLDTCGNYSLIKLRLIDGRKHQIRAHLSQVLNTPILFDRHYGFVGDDLWNLLGQPSGICLHSWQTTIHGMEFGALMQNPTLGSVCTQSDRTIFQAELPSTMKYLFSMLNFPMI